MKLFYTLLFLLVISAILSIILTSIYLTLYNNYLSKRIKNGINTKYKCKKLISPIKMFLVSLFSFYIISCLFISVNNKEIKKDDEIVQLEPCKENSLVDTFDHNSELPGYKRHEKNIDNIRFIYYINNDKKSIFPSLLIYIDSKDKYSFKYHFNNEKELHYHDFYISSENSEWYALNYPIYNCTLTINIWTKFSNNIIDIEL